MMIKALARTSARLVASTVQARAPRLFARELLRHPTVVGAVWPSSRQLAREMASRVPDGGDGLIVELGAGTGVVTQALLDRGIGAGQLIVVERSPTFVRYLRRRFPGIRVVLGDAAKLARYLPGEPRIDAIVSSLPLRSLPPAAVNSIIGQWCGLLPEGGLVVQFTYDLHQAGRLNGSDFVLRDSEIVWANMPPARVMVFTCPPSEKPYPEPADGRPDRIEFPA